MPLHYLNIKCSSSKNSGNILFSFSLLNPLSANSTKWSNTLKQFVGNLPANCFSVFDHFVKLVLKGLNALENGKIAVF